MQYIHSKDIFMLMRDVLKLYDRRLMDHGSKVAYYVYKMLQCKGGYEEYELADMVFLITFHDIGAYKTDNINEIIKFETKEYKAHTLYGYLFFKYLSFVGETAKAILYHHTDYNQMERTGSSYKEIAAYINIAEKVDIYRGSLGGRFNMEIFRKQLGTRISEKAYELFMEANERYSLFDKVQSKEYKKELEELSDYFILSNEDKEGLLEFIMFFLSLKSETVINDAVTSLAMCEIIGKKMGLSTEQLRQLKIAGYLHDIGMIAMPIQVLEPERKLTLREAEMQKQHVLLAERLLQNRLSKEIVAIITAHHERADGSGYPGNMTEKKLNSSQLILQFADAVTILINPRLNRGSYNKEQIINFVTQQTVAGIFSKVVARIFLEDYNEIMDFINMRSAELLSDYRKLNKEFAGTMETYVGE